MKNIKLFAAVLIVTAAFALSAIAQTSLAGLDGSHVDIQGQRGKVVVLAVGACWLPLSGKQAEYTNTLAKRYAGRDVVFYFVTTDSTNAKSKNYADGAALKKFAFQNKLDGLTVLRDP